MVRKEDQTLSHLLWCMHPPRAQCICSVVGWPLRSLFFGKVLNLKGVHAVTFLEETTDFNLATSEPSAVRRASLASSHGLDICANDGQPLRKDDERPPVCLVPRYTAVHYM